MFAEKQFVLFLSLFFIFFILFFSFIIFIELFISFLESYTLHVFYCKSKQLVISTTQAQRSNNIPKTKAWHCYKSFTCWCPRYPVSETTSLLFSLSKRKSSPRNMHCYTDGNLFLSLYNCHPLSLCKFFSLQIFPVRFSQSWDKHDMRKQIRDKGGVNWQTRDGGHDVGGQRIAFLVYLAVFLA